MQRIDENTYIDDTLVTCAEYQLFIDEMREQGKYYQPDHWTPYQFPAGQAREPILGIRCSDAVAFCDWLTQQDNGEWHFRLPMPLEGENRAMEPIDYSPLGFWENKENQTDFIWIEKLPKEATFPIRLGVNRYRPIDLARTLANEPRALDLSRLLARAHQPLVGPFYMPVLDLGIIEARAHGLFHYLTLILNRATDLPQERFNRIDDVMNSAIKIAFERLNSNRSDKDRALHDIQKTDLDNPIINVVTSSGALNLDRYVTLDPSFAAVLAIDIYIDLFTLRERIAGRSPAFEGIRLVKERIR